MTKISLVGVMLPTRTGTELRKRYVSKRTEHQAILLHQLGLTLPSAVEIASVQ